MSQFDKMVAESGSDWFMAGTEGTGQYARILSTDLGTIGFRLTDGFVRVRIEPPSGEAAAQLATKLTVADGWKQPSDWQFRFSKVFYTSEDAIKAVERAIRALGTEGKERRRGTIRYWRGAIREYIPAPTAVAV